MGHSKAITSIAMYPAGTSFASSSVDSTVRLYNIGKEGQHHVIKAHNNRHEQLDLPINQA